MPFGIQVQDDHSAGAVAFSHCPPTAANPADASTPVNLRRAIPRLSPSCCSSNRSVELPTGIQESPDSTLSDALHTILHGKLGRDLQELP